MTKSLLVLIGFSFVLIACDPPQFYVYKNSILKSQNNAVKNIAPEELFEEFLLDELYGFSHERTFSEGNKGNEGTMSMRDGKLKFRDYDSDSHVTFSQINGAFIVQEPFQIIVNDDSNESSYVPSHYRLFFEIVIKPHWSMTPRYTLMEAEILDNQSIVLTPMVLDSEKALKNKNHDLMRTTISLPPPFAKEIRLFEVNNNGEISRPMIDLMKQQYGYKINPLTDAQKKKVVEFAAKYNLKPKPAALDTTSCESRMTPPRRSGGISHYI